MTTTRRYSPKREAVLQNVKSRCDHPTAAMVHTAIREKYPDISLGTVYRNLNELVNQGQLISFVSGGVEHFDGDIIPHLHYCCEGCGEIFDVPAGNSLSRAITPLDGFYVREIQIVVKGNCKSCL